MRALRANDPAFRDLPLVAVGCWCPAVQAEVDRIINEDRLHLAAILAVAADKARARGDSNRATRFLRAAARELRLWRGD